jgi:thiosulfate/3-mercaptopyruvate sulfurtransferase
VQPLITTGRLAELCATPDPPVILDVRWRLGGPSGRQDYGNGHLPGAVFIDLDSELAGPPGAEGRHPLPPTEILQGALRRAGVRTGHPVVAYDAGDGSVAARAWWLLRWSGHSQVAVLDGGYAAWVGEGRAVSTLPAAPAAGDIVVRPGAMPILGATAAAALARTGTLLDARAPERYRGEVEPVDPRAGHVPGAMNAPAGEHVGQDGRWLPAARLADRFHELGVRQGAPVGAYCGSGVTACSVVLALEVSGITSADDAASLYAGSWSHWCADATRPAATGEGPG